LAGIHHYIGNRYAGRVMVLRLDGHLMHAIAAGALIGTWPCPVTAEQAARLPGARAAATALPPPPLPAGSIRAQRRAHASGRIMVNRQPIKLGPRHAGKLVTVIMCPETSHLTLASRVQEELGTGGKCARRRRTQPATSHSSARPATAAPAGTLWPVTKIVADAMIAAARPIVSGLRRGSDAWYMRGSCGAYPISHSSLMRTKWRRGAMRLLRTIKRGGRQLWHILVIIAGGT
jgi:hypothetical protein